MFLIINFSALIFLKNTATVATTLSLTETSVYLPSKKKKNPHQPPQETNITATTNTNIPPKILKQLLWTIGISKVAFSPFPKSFFLV